MSGSPQVPFAAYTELIATLVARRERACELIERRLLNVKDKPAALVRDPRYLDETLSACVFDGLPRDAASLPVRLAAAHTADGFEPLLQHTHPRQLDAAELVVRACEHWNRTRWPGASARLAFADGVWNVFVLRLLQELTLRIWDDDVDGAPARLNAIQERLDGLNDTTRSARLMRDARWLIQVAQGPLTRGLAPYFRVAERIAGSFSGHDAIAIHAAGAKLAGGHLRSQLRARASELDRPADSAAAAAVTRNSNAMDVALLVWDLVPLLEAYDAACSTGETGRRVALADAIVQGCSADPELLLARLDLLGPCTTVETVFVHHANGRPALTATGRTHARMLERYADLVDRAAPSLIEDAPAFDPARHGYSPLAIAYGFCGDLLSAMALHALSGNGMTGISLEDVFTHGGEAAAKQARGRFALSESWAEDVFVRTTQALALRATNQGRLNATATRTGSLALSPTADRSDAQQYCITSDVNLALATGATAFPRGQIVADRREGRFLASAETDGRWFAVSKMMVSERIAGGRDAVLTGVPQDVVDILRLTCGPLWPTCSR